MRRTFAILSPFKCCFGPGSSRGSRVCPRLRRCGCGRRFFVFGGVGLRWPASPVSPFSWRASLGGSFSLWGRPSSLRGMASSPPGMASSLPGNLRERTGNAVWSLSPARSDHSSAGESHLLGRGTLSAVSRRLSPSGEWHRREGETLSLCGRRDRTGRARSEPAAPAG